ncbi:PDE2A [Symbiodinium microadriaticum]|nr:PDE2A [Symbiodinium microadriaticum]CAE7377807.1 PDE2A [Symbiodinium sp. KB8]
MHHQFLRGRRIHGRWGAIGAAMCHAHSSQKALEKAIETDPRAQELVGTLINNYAKDKTNPGGFARAVKNAPRLASMYASNIAEIDGILSKAYKTKSMSFAAQRFDSIMQITQTVIYHLVPIMNTLSELQVKDATFRPWCQGLLKCLSPDRLILVALLAELSRSDIFCPLAKNLGIEVSALVKEYQIALPSMSFLEKPFPQKCRFVSFHLGFQAMKAMKAMKATKTMKVMKAMKAMKAMKKAKTRSGPSGWAKWMTKKRNDKARIREEELTDDGGKEELTDDGGSMKVSVSTQTPPWIRRLRRARDLEDMELVGHDSLVQKSRTVAALGANEAIDFGDRLQGETDLRSCWEQVAKHWCDRLPNLARAVMSLVGVLLASFVATSEVEQAFSFVEMYSAKRKHSTLPEHLRAMLRVRLDGMACAVQQTFLNMFGGPQFQQFLKTIENAAKRKRERAAADPCTYKDKEFRTALSKDASLQEAVQAIRSAPTGVQDVPLEAAGAVVLCNSENCLVRLGGIARLGLTCSRFLNTVAQYRELLLLPPRKILWYVDASSEENFVVPDRKVATTAFLMASRVLGGYVATEEWAKVCTGAARLLAPPMQLKSFAERKQQWPSCIGHHVSGALARLELVLAQDTHSQISC